MRKSSIAYAIGLGLGAAATLPMSGCFHPSVDRSMPSTVTDTLQGVSPQAVQMQWAAVNTADHYIVTQISQNQTPLVSTPFTAATVGKLSANTQYSMAVRPIYGTGFNLPVVDSWTFTTWSDFSQEDFRLDVNAKNVTVSWTYLPWTKLPPTEDAEFSSDIACSFLPWDGVTDPTTLDPFTTLAGTGATVFTGAIADGQMVIDRNNLDPLKQFVVGCQARFIDGTKSTTITKRTLQPRHKMAACNTLWYTSDQYDCDLEIRQTADSSLLDTQWQLVTTGAAVKGLTLCNWTSLSTDGLHLIGTPGTPDIGTCSVVLTYKYLEDPTTASDVTRLTSPPVILAITVKAKPPFEIFPSFAVRGLSGAIAAYDPAAVRPTPSPVPSGTPSPIPHSKVEGSIISDFGAGNAFFAGGDTPFPTPSAMPSASTQMYGFPTGYTLDYVRDTAALSGYDTGYLSGNLIVPRTRITNANFLSATGWSSTPYVLDFLNNRFRTSATANTTQPPLSTYLNSLISGTQSSYNVYDRATVTIQAPSRPTLLQYFSTNSTDVMGQVVQGDLKTTTSFAKSIPFPPRGTADKDPATGSPAPVYTTLGLLLKPNSNGTRYFTNQTSGDVTLYCYGDLVFRAPILLKNVTINVVTPATDCRIYSTETIFIQGYVNNDKPVQFSSAKAVVFGFSSTSLGLNQGAGAPNIPLRAPDGIIGTSAGGRFLTRQGDTATSAYAFLDSIANDALTVHLDNSDNTLYSDDTGISALSTGSFKQIAVNAPIVLSNYTKPFSGSISAEALFFRQLDFKSDASLRTITAFPLLTGANAPVIVSDQ